MITLRDLFDQDQLGEAIGDGYVRVQHHPELPLVIYNYTQKCQDRRAWNEVTMTCRGLVAHPDTGDLVARGFRKFFEYSDPCCLLINLDEQVVVTDKIDGALGILVPLGGGQFQVATRGSFASVPALHATEVWNERYAGHWAPPDGLTALFEIVYLGWRIVLDYGDLDDLVLLGFVDTATGIPQPPTETYGWPGPVTEVFPYRSLPEALAAEPRADAEGLVVQFLDSGNMVKLKQADYLQLHRLFFHLTTRRIWTNLAVPACQHLISEPKHWASRLRVDPRDVERALAAGDGWLESLTDLVPAEFHAWLNKTINGIRTDVDGLRAEITATYEEYAEVADTRLEFIQLSEDHPHRGALVLLYDQQPIDPYLWLAVRPAHEVPFAGFGEGAE